MYLSAGAPYFQLLALYFKKLIFLKFCTLIHPWVLFVAMTFIKSKNSLVAMKTAKNQIWPFLTKFALILAKKTLISSAHCTQTVYYWNLTIKSHERLTIALMINIIKGP